MAFNKTGGKLQGLKEKSAAHHACLTSLQSTELAAEGGFTESPASTCPHWNPRWLSQTTGPPQRPPSGVILSSHADFFEAQDVYSINLNYLEISDSLYRFIPVAELTILPFKKKTKLFLPWVEGDSGVWGTGRGISATLSPPAAGHSCCVLAGMVPPEGAGPERRGWDAAGRDSPLKPGVSLWPRKTT